MSIKSAAFNVCKELDKLSILKDTRNLIQDLRFRSQDKPDRSMFGYNAQNAKIQFLGYILVDERKDEVNKHLPISQAITSLAQEEKELFLKFHKFNEYINNKAIQAISKYYSELTYALDPYFVYQYKTPESIDISKDFSSTFEAVNKLIDEISKSYLIDTFSKFQYQIFTQGSPGQGLLEATHTLEERLKESNVHDSPSDFMELEHTMDKNSLQYSINKLLLSIIIFRGILSNINQLIYQNVRDEKFYILNEDNIIEVRQNFHQTANGVSIKAQPSESFSPKMPNDIIFIDYKTENLNGLYHLHRYTFSMNQETGELEDFAMRKIDDNLSFWYPK